MKFPKKGWTKWVVIALHVFTTLALILIGIFFTVIIFKDLYEVFKEFFLGNHLEANYILERVFLIFLYVEVVAAVKIYFSEHFHFPLKFFIYIGITDLVRQIIIQREHAQEVLLHAIALIILVLALAILEIKNNWLMRHKTKDDEHFEL